MRTSSTAVSAGQPGTGVDTQRHVQLARLLVKREEPRLGQGALALDPPCDKAHRAPFARPIELLNRGRDVMHGQYRHPAQPPLARGRRRSQIPVVSPGERDVQLRIEGKVSDEEGREDDLHVHAHLVGIVQAGARVDQRLGRPGAGDQVLRLWQGASAVPGRPCPGGCGTRSPSITQRVLGRPFSGARGGRSAPVGGRTAPSGNAPTCSLTRRRACPHR